MNENPRMPLSPGDRVTVVKGTFAGIQGVVVSLEEAQWIGGEVPTLKPVTGAVWVVLTLFGRPTAVNLLFEQLSRS
jgi:transcription antitermination factor NusG